MLRVGEFNYDFWNIQPFSQLLSHLGGFSNGKLHWIFQSLHPKSQLDALISMHAVNMLISSVCFYQKNTVYLVLTHTDPTQTLHWNNTNSYFVSSPCCKTPCLWLPFLCLVHLNTCYFCLCSVVCQMCFKYQIAWSHDPILITGYILGVIIS
jgi:hypothetical protein